MKFKANDDAIIRLSATETCLVVVVDYVAFDETYIYKVWSEIAGVRYLPECELQGIAVVRNMTMLQLANETPSAYSFKFLLGPLKTGSMVPLEDPLGAIE